MFIFACKKFHVEFFLKALASMLTCLVSVQTGTTHQSSITLKASHSTPHLIAIEIKYLSR